MVSIDRLSIGRSNGSHGRFQPREPILDRNGALLGVTHRATHQQQIIERLRLAPFEYTRDDRRSGGCFKSGDRSIEL